MAKEFSHTDLRLVRSLMKVKSDEDIAVIIDRTTEEVTTLIREMTGDISPYHQKLNRPKRSRWPGSDERKMQREQKKQERLQAQIDKRKQKELEAEERRQLREQKKAKADWEKRQGRELKKLVAQQNADRAAAKRKREEPQFRTRQVDYSQRIAVRIDHKTIIYCKPGDNISEVKKRYLERLKDSKTRMGAPDITAHEVKKFKPIK